MKKTLSFMLVLTLILSLAGIPAFAAEGGIEQITFDKGSMFTVGLEEEDQFQYEVKGLVKDQDGNYQKVDITDEKNINWTSSNDEVAKIVGATTGKATTIEAVSEGQARIKATYKGMSVESTVNVFDKSNKVSVARIESTVKFPTKDKLEHPEKVSDEDLLEIVDKLKIEKLDNFSLLDVYGDNYNDSGVSKDKVTALHAFLYALEVTNNPNFINDHIWTWVPKNVRVDYNGSFVSAVGVYKNYGMTGWMYKVNGEMPMVAASQYELKDGDKVVWNFATWGEEW